MATIKTVYGYDPDTLIFSGEQVAMLDPRATERLGKEVFMIPANTVEFPPASELLTDGMIAILDNAHLNWKIKKNRFNLPIFSKKDGSPYQFSDYGAIPAEYTEIVPITTYPVTYQKFDEATNTWIFNEDKREDLLAAIWTVRKNLRDQACNADLLYNEHYFHADAKSLNDLLLACNEAMLEDDNYTKIWVTADSINVILKKADLIAIMKAYGARRQALVYASNEAWQADLKLSNEELVEVYSALIKGE